MKKILIMVVLLSLTLLSGCDSAKSFAKNNAQLAFETLLGSVETTIKVQEVDYACYVWEEDDGYIERACNYFIVYTHEDSQTPRYAEVIIGEYAEAEKIRDVTIYLARVEFISARDTRLGEHADNLVVNAENEGVKLSLDVGSLSNAQIRRALRRAH